MSWSLSNGSSPITTTLEYLLRAASHTTPAKSRDHEIVRAQKKVSKGLPNTPPKSCSVSRILKCSVKSYVTGATIKCYFNEFVFMRVLTYDELE